MSAPDVSRGSARRTRVVVVTVVALLAAGVAGWLVLRQPDGPTTFGGDRALALAESRTTAATTPPTTTVPPSTTSTPVPPPAPAAEPAGGPIRELRLPEQDVRATVVPVGVAADGTMEIPEDVRTAGWYRFGPLPGAASGSVVISGHINDRDQGPGVFATLAEVGEGDPVVVTLADGREIRYRVVARERFDKEVVPMDRIFDRGGEPRLTLVTCGGAFDRSSGHYKDNIVVTAVQLV